jgi:hypothetical protein
MAAAIGAGRAGCVTQNGGSRILRLFGRAEARKLRFRQPNRRRRS